jgi:hypothetical protein
MNAKYPEPTLNKLEELPPEEVSGERVHHSNPRTDRYNEKARNHKDDEDDEHE